MDSKDASGEFRPDRTTGSGHLLCASYGAAAGGTCSCLVVRGRMGWLRGTVTGLSLSDLTGRCRFAVVVLVRSSRLCWA